MKILVAEDEPVSRKLLQAVLGRWGYEVKVASDGGEAWDVLTQESAPLIAILDWMMPLQDGVQLSRRVREAPRAGPTYIILLTARGGKQNIVEGLESGADDYLTKPFDQAELRARIRVGARVLQLQWELAERIKDLESALGRVNQLQGLLPICSYCKRVRDDRDYWHQVESYVAEHSSARFTHGICPECYSQVLQREIEALEE